MKINNYKKKKTKDSSNRNSNKVKIIYLNNNENTNSSYLQPNSNLNSKTLKNTPNKHNTSILNSSNKINNDIIEIKLNPPFIGRSNYELMYPNWKTTKIIKEKEKVNVLESIPFNGRSSYKENYNLHEKRYYLDLVSPIIKADNLETSGKLINETTARVSYQPINYKEYYTLNNNFVKVLKKPSSIIPAPYSRDSFLSSYERAFMYNNIKTRSFNINFNNGTSNSVIH